MYPNLSHVCKCMILCTCVSVDLHLRTEVNKLHFTMLYNHYVVFLQNAQRYIISVIQVKYNNAYDTKN